MKNRTTAALLALIFGVFGMHYFYLNRIGLGIMCVIFTFTGGLAPVAAIIGFVNFLILLTMNDEDFNKRYNRDMWREMKRRNQEGDFTEPVKERNRDARERMKRRNQDGDFTEPVKERNRNRDARERMKPTPQYVQPKPKPDINQKETLKQSGLKKYKEFDYFSAIEDFGKALAIDNKDMSFHWNLTCLYSLTEQKELAFYHLEKAVELGFRDYDKVKSHDALSFLRIQPEFDEFARNGFKLPENMEHSDILQQLKELSQKREMGLLSEKEFAEQTRRVVES